MLEFPLYHGTSTIFLESIKKHGLGGWEPIKEWRVLECAQKLLPLAEEYANRSQEIKKHQGTTRTIFNQVITPSMNFQHGQVYLSPVESTAVRYATSKKYGSELISRVLLIIDELIRLNVKTVNSDLYKEFPEIYNLLDMGSAPIIIKLDRVKKESLLSEKGASPDESIKFIRSAITKSNSRWPMVCQQHNFRLLKPVPANELSVSLISLRSSGVMGMNPDYGLIDVKM
jgi:hypothetical protein